MLYLRGNRIVYPTITMDLYGSKELTVEKATKLFGKEFVTNVMAFKNIWIEVF